MNRAKFAYELVITSSSLVGGVVGSSTFAFESRHNGAISMFGAAVLGGTVGLIGGFFTGATSPIVIPGLLIATAFTQSESGSKKLIAKSNSILAGHKRNGTIEQAPPPGSPSAPVSV